jgi:preprotein translocase subunit SecG
MQFIILLLHVLVCLSIITLVLLQQSKGGEMGGAFGGGSGGASQTVFGSSGAGSFLLKLTGGLAIIFFVTSLFLGHLVAQQGKTQALSLPGKTVSKTQTNKRQQS